MYPLAAHDGDVHILVEGLRSTEAARIAQAQARPLSGIVAQVGTRTEDYVIDEAVLIQTAADK